MVVQILVAVADTWFVGRLGFEALAGIALVIPFITLMMNIANGGMGGAVASSFARALGAHRQEDARALVLHALLLGWTIALLFTLLAWALAPAIFRAMGGKGPALEQALAYTRLWFSGSVLLWTTAFLSALLRGAGNAATPARIGLISSIVYVPLSGALTLGYGLIGSAAASLLASTLSTLLLVRAVRQGRLGIAPKLADVRLQGRLFGEILRVGALGSLSTTTASLTAVVVTGLVGHFGTAALAGYGIGVRLEFMVSPVAFGIGAGAITLVGIAAGAGDWWRAVRVAWIAGLTGFLLIGAMGWAVALLPETWSRLFTSQPEVVEASVAFLTRVAPFHCLFGLGLTLYFASQGAGRMMVPVLAGVARMLVATAGGWFVAEWLGWGLNGVFVATGASLIVYGCLIAGTLFIAPWRARSL